MRLAIPTLIAVLALPAFAAEAPLPPPLPDELPAEAVDTLEPEVSIERRGETTVEEYRINGRIYMIKITPDKGYPYYLIDHDGDGSLETRRNELDAPPLNMWRLLSW